jgi:phosphatidylglycerophosphate synthase
MGDPLLRWSFDAIFFYPYIVDPWVPYCKSIHPNCITLFNIIVKYYTYMQVIAWNYTGLLWLGTLERFLDCLDGRVARRFNKCSPFGHALDKYSDLIFRFFTAYRLICMAIPLFQQDFLSPFLLFIVCASCPAIFIIDSMRGKIQNLETQRDSVAIVVEDNATLLCLILPILQFFCVLRCDVA